MKNFIKLLGIAALVAVIGFSMIACDSGGGGSSNNNNSGGSGGNLAGTTWIHSSGSPKYFFKSNGDFFENGQDMGMWSTSGSTLTFKGGLAGNSSQTATATYSVSGSTLTISDASINFITEGTYNKE